MTLFVAYRKNKHWQLLNILIFRGKDTSVQIKSNSQTFTWYIYI